MFTSVTWLTINQNSGNIILSVVTKAIRLLWWAENGDIQESRQQELQVNSKYLATSTNWIKIKCQGKHLPIIQVIKMQKENSISYAKFKAKEDKSNNNNNNNKLEQIYCMLKNVKEICLFLYLWIYLQKMMELGQSSLKVYCKEILDKH